MEELQPVMGQVAAMLSSLHKRDKLTRLVDYAYRWRVHRLDTDGDKEGLAHAKGVLAAIKKARKMFRFGKTIQFLLSVLKLQAERDAAARVLGQVRALGYAGWMCFDGLVLLAQLGIVQADVKANVARGMRCWVLALLAACALDVHKLRRSRLRRQAGADPKQSLEAYQKEQQGLALQLGRDVIDLAIPTHSLGWAPRFLVPHGGAAALCGIATSLICIYQEWPARK